ncbi:unnamed protein product [Cuscuta campestris]|uniref:Uncharacterized protein n=1 Tax=Cuscuta campestris TaxID=132261 RepID=A0A484N837_9ASTE|nr:unnamed protein product [Cuscuta campestris]
METHFDRCEKDPFFSADDRNLQTGERVDKDGKVKIEDAQTMRVRGTIPLSKLEEERAKLHMVRDLIED